MGTRHLICIVKDEEMKLAQYGQWDGYPDGQGADIVRFLGGVDLEAFKGKVDKIVVLTEEEVLARWRSVGADDSGYVGMDVSAAFKEKWPQLSRDSGANTLPYIMETDTPEVQPFDVEFARDSLFCEWAYVLDLDKGVLEVYKGFQKEEHNDGRFAHMGKKGDYWPVRLLATFSMSDIPKDWIKQLPKEEEEDDG